MDVTWPKEFTSEDKKDLAMEVRRDIVQAMRQLEARWLVDPRESKVLVLHITREPGTCHKCGLPVPLGESACRCRSVNLDW